MQLTNYQASNHDEPHGENVNIPRQAPVRICIYKYILYITKKENSTNITQDIYKENIKPKLTTSAMYTRATSSSKQPKFLNNEYKSPPFKYSITRYKFSRQVNE